MSLLGGRLKRVCRIPLTLSTPFGRPGRGAAAAAARTAPSAGAHPPPPQGPDRSSRRAPGAETAGRCPRTVGQGTSGACPARAHQPGKRRGVGRVLPGAGEASPREGAARKTPGGFLSSLGELQSPLADLPSRRGRKNTWFGDQLPPGRSRAQSPAATLIASRSRSLPKRGVLLLRVALLPRVPQQPHENRSGQAPSDQQGGPDGAHG